MQALEHENTLFAYAAEDLLALAKLHSAEVNVPTLHAMYQAGFPQGLLLLPEQDAQVQALTQRMSAILQEMGTLTPQEQTALYDDLAVDFAAIYLNHTLRASPLESVWLDEEQLVLQGPTFAVREFYKKFHMQVANWRLRPDDHLVNELEFVALMLHRQEYGAALGFLQQHLLQWLPLFAERVSQRSESAFYATLAQMTAAACAYCAQLLLEKGVQAVTVAPPAAPCGQQGAAETCGGAGQL